MKLNGFCGASTLQDISEHKDNEKEDKMLRMCQVFK